jgi:hypothetical protein
MATRCKAAHEERECYRANCIHLEIMMDDYGDGDDDEPRRKRKSRVTRFPGFLTMMYHH